ncbi:hypothetical protein [Streptosporangium sandarakinum]|uniref:hypothetical protein n=1 Tax=Streptosporangium sandarakinum TaxID=1260955 RepID=UPI00342F5450
MTDADDANLPGGSDLTGVSGDAADIGPSVDADLTTEQAAVFRAVSELESSVGPGHVAEIARVAGLDPGRVEEVLEELIGGPGLVVAATDPWHPELGPRYQVQSPD